jgi:flagellin
MTVINTNIAAAVTANAMKANARAMESTMERLATGTRVNSAKDDAAGLGIGSKMTSQIRGYEQAVRNANDGISMLQTVDGAASQVTDLLQRMRELAVQGNNGTNSSSDLANLDSEFSALATEIDRIATTTKFNGVSLMNSSQSKDIVVGELGTDKIQVNFGDFQLASGASTTKAVDTFAASLTEIQAALTTHASSTLTLTDSNGGILSVTVTNATGAANLKAATLAQLVTGINNAMDANETFAGGGMLAASNASNQLIFTQDDPGSGQITGFTVSDGATANSANVVDATTGVIRTVSRTTTGSSGAGQSPMFADISGFKTAGSSNVHLSGTITSLDNAIAGVNTARASYGANISRLGHSVDNLEVAIANTSAARSSVMDADYASETTELARTQIISQASTAMLSQANQQAQSVLALLK